MTKSKRVSLRIISLISLVVIFVMPLVFFHIVFPTKYSDAIMAAAQKYELDPNLVRAVIWTESKYDQYAISSKGACGLMQLMPSTAEFVADQLGYNYEPQMLLDAQTNIELGCCYLRYLLDRFDDEETALAAYNAGEGNVQKWQQQKLESIPYKETKDYVKRVKTVKKIYSFKSR